jgi:hypothetical protein
MTDRGRSALGIAATAVLLATSAAAAGLLWITVTDPLGVATSAVSGGVWSLIAAAAARLFALF